ncbi:cysteine dioxygenase [Neobacillus cucumis]|uniref:cysteine dioxygenase n=1 Tax=Neobacillus cucumis TaxID=1740721 RepID=UPI001963F8F4|nr:cysteine dioxygenase family protein [Neobacillus cucumis]MBM7656246.1 cysteine dioxygenase [Neobacillus cucumis]
MNLLACIHQHLGGLTTPTLNELGDALKRISDASKNIAPYIKEPNQYPYGRHVIYKNDVLEVIVINLPPDKETAIHDHGESIGCAMVLEGEVLNTIYHLNEHKIERSSSYLVQHGECFFSKPGLIHKLTNSQSERMISLHVYSPPLQNMATFQEQGNYNQSVS